MSPVLHFCTSCNKFDKTICDQSLSYFADLLIILQSYSVKNSKNSVHLSLRKYLPKSGLLCLDTIYIYIYIQHGIFNLRSTLIPIILHSLTPTGSMHEGRLSLNPGLVPDLVLPTTFSVCTKAD